MPLPHLFGTSRLVNGSRVAGSLVGEMIAHRDARVPSLAIAKLGSVEIQREFMTPAAPNDTPSMSGGTAMVSKRWPGSRRKCRVRRSEQGFWSSSRPSSGRWPGSESPFCALRMAMDLDDGGVDHRVFQVGLMRARSPVFNGSGSQALGRAHHAFGPFGE